MILGLSLKNLATKGKREKGKEREREMEGGKGGGRERLKEMEGHNPHCNKISFISFQNRSGFLFLFCRLELQFG